MASDPTKPYVKLPGRGRRGTIVSIAQCSLWMGTDHLIQVDGTRFSEDYKRFYFKDIKAIIVRRTSTWMVINGVLLALAIFFMGLFGLIAWSVSASERQGFLIAGGCFAGFFLFIDAINLLRGPTCACHLRTPVQEEELPSLKRVRTARKALQRIRTAVEAVQGSLSESARQEIAARIAQYEGLPVEAISPQATQMPPALPTGNFAKLRLNLVLIIALAFCCALELLSIAGLRSLFTWSLNSVAHVAIGGISIAILARLPQHVGKAIAWARVAVWGIVFGANAVYYYVMMIRYTIEHPRQQVDMAKVLQSLPDSYYVAMGIAVAIHVVWLILEIIAFTRAKKALVFARAPVPPAEVVTSTDLY